MALTVSEGEIAIDHLLIPANAGIDDRLADFECHWREFMALKISDPEVLARLELGINHKRSLHAGEKHAHRS